MEKKEKIIKIGLMAAILLFILLIFYTNLFHYNYKMNADIGAEAVLGELIWQSKKILPDTWYPSTEARIISTPNVAALFYGITGNMSLAMGLGCCFMTALIILGILFFCQKAEIRGTDCLLMVFVSLAAPVNFIFLELVYVYAGYYAIQTAILFFTLGIYVTIIHTKQIKCSWLLTGLLAALLLGFQGMRGILVLYGPLFGVEIIRGLFFWYSQQRAKWADRVAGLWSFMLLIVSFVGTCFPFSASQTLSRNIRKGFTKLFTVVIPDMGNLLGFGSSCVLSQACILVFVILSVYLVIEILWRLLKKRTIHAIEWAYLVIFASPLVSAFMVAFTTIESTPRYYFMLIYAMAFTAVLFQRKFSVFSVFVNVLAFVLALTNIYQIYLPVYKSGEPPCSDAYEVVCYLEENEIFTAYADFENANTMTTLSNGKVRVAAVASVAKMDICKWLSSTEWYPPNQPYDCVTAYIVTTAEENEFRQFMEGKEGTIREVEKIGKYVIYISDFNYANFEGE